VKPAILIEGLGKKYRVTKGAQQGGYRTLRESLVDVVTAPLRRLRSARDGAERAEDFWALKDVSFEVQPGEAIGIIGRNGAGKSTLLKILSRITKPSSGRAEINGRVGSLLEVGTGFHPELTGRENVYLNGSILGMSRKEIERKFDEIVGFAGVETFLDTPVKRYSSGMYVRLAFAVAAHLEPEILIVDEVLAVGDAEFQKKCLSKMRSVSQTGHTVLLVSHNLVQVESLCGRAIRLKKGQVVGLGRAADQVRDYLAESRSEHGPMVDLRNRIRATGVTSIITGLSVSVGGLEGSVIRMDSGFVLKLMYELPRKPRELRFGIILENEHGVKVTHLSPTFQDPHLLDDAPATGVVQAEVTAHNLVAGRYYANLYAASEGLWDVLEPAGVLEIEAADVFGSGRAPNPKDAVTYLPCRWSKSW
jgi:lipopolysaccharide transport system ATP-binding protein